MITKKVPERRCVGCGKSFPKRDLIRVVRTPEGEVKLDLTGRMNGRGAYICRSAECFRTARKKNKFSSNLGIAIPDPVMDALEKKVAQSEKEDAAAQ